MADGTTESTGPWRLLDETVTVTFTDIDGSCLPQRVRWRGSEWSVIGTARHWSTWRAFPVLTDSTSSTLRSVRVRGLTADFWRFQAQTDPVSPLLHFEVRRAGQEWRLVRLGATFSVPD